MMKQINLNIEICALALCMSFISLNSFSNNRNQIKEEKRISQLLSKMTLDEKIGQMNLITFFDNQAQMSSLIKEGKVSSIINITDPEEANRLQTIAIEKSRLGIPLLFGRDVIHGFKTIFPIPLGQAASFDPELIQTAARISAIEASSTGIKWTFAPMVDIARDPRWGRVAESCGEDPFLTSVIASAMIKGFQGDGSDIKTSIASCPKHFVGYGAAEGGRDYNSAYIPERLLRNVYLPPFESAVKAGSYSMMCSFNDNDGIPSSGNEFLLKQILRKEWNFDGFVVSDWESIREMINHGFVSDEKDAAMKAVNAGVNMEMVSTTYNRYLKLLVKEGKVSEKTINDAVSNILRIKFRLGLFEHPYVDLKTSGEFYAPSHLAIAKRASAESVILLKNDKNILPLSDSIKTIAVIGPMADDPYEQLGTWIFDGDKKHTQTPLNALKESYGNKIKIIYEQGLSYSRDKNINGIKKAVEAAKKSDVILAFVGEESILSGEAHCLADLNLQGKQSELIESLSKTGKPLVTIVIAGRPLTIGNEAFLSTALLYCFHPGTMGGPAIVDLLFGKEVPSGKAPITFPKTVGQIPIYYDHTNTGRPALGNEILLDKIPIEASQTALGNTSFYLDAGYKPLYPFGFGLSYTTFEYSSIHLSTKTLCKNDTLKIHFDLKNTGKYAGTEVVQIYIQDVVGSVNRPVKELKGFKRITLKPDEKQTFNIEIPIEELAFWNIKMKKEVEPGAFNLWIGSDSESGEKLVFNVIDRFR